jgi:hypothetical protein
MYLQKVINKKTLKKISFLMAPWEDQWRKWQDPDPHSDPNPDPLVRGMDP